MKHASFNETCGVCAALAGPKAAEPIFENGLWHVRHIEPPWGVAGWMLLVSRRHVSGPAHFDDREAASFGPTLRHLERTLEEVSGALRIYTAALGESHPQFHAHMVPRYDSMPKDARGWAVFDLQRTAAAGEFTIDVARVQGLVEGYRRALAVRPPPSP